jgi:hypothetical protein
MQPIRMEKLLASSVDDLAEAERDSFYGRGWLLTHYLTLDPARKGQLSAYLVLLNSGTDSLTAGKKVFGDLAELDKELNRYVRQRTLRYIKLAPDAIKRRCCRSPARPPRPIPGMPSPR